MQEVPNEGIALHHRTTAGGRKLTYELVVEQGPKHARACGNGPRSSADRRPVDPPPVIRLKVLDGGHDITALYDATFMLFASLEHARPIARGVMYATNHCPVLTGVCVAGAAYLTKPVTAAYFIFPDLSVRHEGWYRFKFHLFEQTKRREDFDQARLPVNFGVGTESAPAPNDQETMVNMTFVYTEPFQVFSAKKFPGLEQSTPLSKIIADQGCRVRIRRDIRQRKADTKNPKKDLGDRQSLRMANHDRLDSIDTQDHWNRVGSFDTRRPSVDSQASQGYVPSRHASFAQSALPSPTMLPHPVQYAQQSHHTGARTGQVAVEAEETWNRSMYGVAPPQPSVASARHSIPTPVHRTGYSPILPATSCSPPASGLPSIATLIHPVDTPCQPPRPQGGYYNIASPAAKKRGLTQSPDASSYTLKDRARPQLTPVPPKDRSGMLALIDGPQYPLAGGNDIIEAEADDDRSDSGDSLLDDAERLTTYKRCTGEWVQVPQRHELLRHSRV